MDRQDFTRLQETKGKEARRGGHPPAGRHRGAAEVKGLAAHRKPTSGTCSCRTSRLWSTRPPRKLRPSSCRSTARRRKRRTFHGCGSTASWRWSGRESSQAVMELPKDLIEPRQEGARADRAPAPAGRRAGQEEAGPPGVENNSLHMQIGLAIGGGPGRSRDAIHSHMRLDDFLANLGGDTIGGGGQCAPR